jgi:hypothetical protein
MLLLALLAACANPCQELCAEMANYASEDCELTVTEDSVDACRERYSNITEEQAGQCIEANDPEQLREWWSCEELAENYTDGSK